MKNVILTFMALVAVAVQSHAQEKGKFWVGGSLGVNSANLNDASKTRTYSLSPEFGYAFSDSWAAGIRFSVTQQNGSEHRYDETYITDSGGISLGFSPFVRYAALSWKSFRVFVDGGLSYDRTKYDQNIVEYGAERLDYRNTTNTYGIFIGSGVSFRLSPRVELTGTFDFVHASYSKTHYDRKEQDTGWTESDNKTFSAGVNSLFQPFTIGVGFNFHF